MFMAEGFNGFVSKPVVMSELERVLKGIFPVPAITYGEDVPAEALEMEEAFKKDELDILRDGGITVENGLDYCMGDRELYKEVLVEYALDGEIKKTELEGYMGDRSWDDFRIRVHAVKSSSKTIGAEKLFRSAEMLEEASGDHKEETIMLLYPEFLSEYNRVTELIRSIYDVRAAEDDAYEI
jgi:HPt (histidine-containing phosphotransfer) domain-containing protein